MQVNPKIAKMFSYNPTWSSNSKPAEQLSSLEIDDRFEQDVSSTSMGTKLGFGTIVVLTALGVVGCSSSGTPTSPAQDPNSSVVTNGTTYTPNSQKSEKLEKLSPEEMEQRIRELELKNKEQEKQLKHLAQQEKEEKIRRNVRDTKKFIDFLADVMESIER